MEPQAALEMYDQLIERRQRRQELNHAIENAESQVRFNLTEEGDRTRVLAQMSQIKLDGEELHRVEEQISSFQNQLIEHGYFYLVANFEPVD